MASTRECNTDMEVRGCRFQITVIISSWMHCLWQCSYRWNGLSRKRNVSPSQRNSLLEWLIFC